MPFVYYYRRLKMTCPQFNRHLRKICTPSRLLYFVNILFSSILVFQIFSRNSPTTKSQKSKIVVSFVENYQNDIANSMEAFDFMHRQRLAAKSIPPPDDYEERAIVEKLCFSFPWTPKSFYNRSSVRRNNVLWQSVTPSATEIYLYSAFFDDRPNVIFPRATGFVQVIGVVWRRLPASIDVYCQLWSSDDSPLSVVKALSREIWQRAWDPRDRFYVPHLFTCPLTSAAGSPVPAYVSLVVDGDLCSRDSTFSTFLPVRTHRPDVGLTSDREKKHTVVCVKGMDFLEDLSQRFVEWLELNFHVGASKVAIYTYSVHPRVKRVIEHYAASSSLGLLEHIPLTLPGHAPNAPLHRSRYIRRNRQQKRRHEIVPYNDCLYRHLGAYDYVLIVDVDELVVPLKHRNWKEMLQEVKGRRKADGESWTAFSVANAFFFDNLTAATTIRKRDSNLHILTHDRRSKKISPPGVYGKSFVDTRNVATVFNHFPLHKQRRRANQLLKSTFYVDPDLARKNHYKGSCPIESRDECPDLYARTVLDDSATRYAADVAPKIKKAFNNLGIEP